MENCISVSQLRVHYGQIKAVDGISFEVGCGRAFGFLGPNGAGKTTTIKVLTTLTHPTSGNVSIFGKDVVRHAKEIKRRIGVVLQEPSFEGNVTVEKALDLYGMMWGIEGDDRRDKVRELLERFDLVEIRDIKNDELSIGQRRRVQVARELMHNMDLLFLDEPTVGLDPAARRTLLDYVKQHVRKGLTVFFTTHIMEEVEYLCDEIAIVDKGKLVASDTPAGLKQKYGKIKAVEVKLKEAASQSTMQILRQAVGSEDTLEIASSNVIRISSNNSQDVLVKTIGVLAKNSIQIESVSINPPTLEEVFLTAVSSKPSKFAS